MAGKKWLFVLGFVNVLAIAGIVFWYINRDSKPPVITREGEIIYEETMTDEELLAGVVAKDINDGDVSNTLVVEKVAVNPNSGKAVVTYGAMDQSGNIAKQSFPMEMKEVLPEVIVEDSSEPAEGEVFTLEAGEAVIDVETMNETVTEEETTEETTEEITEEASEEENADNDDSQDEEDSGEESEAQEEESPRHNTAQNTQPQVNPEEIPVINFNTTEVKTRKGYNPAWVTVISQMQDNKDNYEYLLQHLVIHGNYTNAEVGTYDVSVSTVDSDGNESAARAIRIIVEEY